MSQRSEDILNKCKAAAVIIAAVSGFVLGVLNWFKETKDPKAKAGYSELAQQVEGLAKDVQHLTETVKTQQDQLRDLQQWILYDSQRRGATVEGSEKKILKSFKTQKPVPMPAPRKPPKWEALQKGN